MFIQRVEGLVAHGIFIAGHAFAHWYVDGRFITTENNQPSDFDINSEVKGHEGRSFYRNTQRGVSRGSYGGFVNVG